MVAGLDGRNPAKFKPEIVDRTPFPGDALVTHRMRVVACCCVSLPIGQLKEFSVFLHVVDFQGGPEWCREGSSLTRGYN